MLNQIIKTSPHNSFKVTQLTKTIAICEAIKGDKHGWSNATTTEPAFIAYFGCQKEEAPGHIKTFKTLYGVNKCKVRSPKYLSGWEVEIKIWGMQRHSNNQVFGLDYLVMSEVKKENPYELGMVQNGIHQIPAYTRIKVMTFKTQDGEEVEFQLSADYPTGKFIRSLVHSGNYDHLSYVKTEFFWQRNWDQEIDGEF